ncbi:MAG TPA: DUF3515 family protein [Dermatophilaceae bacterium]|nr:DUF3515 family protein [Dermatophilaceae bacterium]
MTTAAVTAVLGVSALGGCGSAVDVAAAPSAQVAGCAAAAREWPGTVSGLERGEVPEAATAAAAWGDPAVVARCGVPAPGPTTAECLEVDGLGWIAAPLTDGTRFTSFGTEPAVEVLVPRRYAPEPLLLPAFTPAAKALPSNGLRCR